VSEKPRASGLRSAREAFLRADYDMCVGLLSARRGIERDLLLARCYVRMNRLDDAERVLAASRGQGRSMWASLMAQLLIRRGDTVAASTYLDRALAASPNDQERSEAQYLRALLEWTAMRRDNAERILDSEQFGSFSGNAESLRGWLSIAKGDYASALNSLEGAVKLFGSDIYLECNALRTASNLAREMYMPAVMARVLHRVQRIEWTPYLQVPRFYIMRSAAWFRAIDGEYAEAMRQFHEIAALNIADPWRLYTYCDRAYFSFVLGEDINGWATAEEALALADLGVMHRWRDRRVALRREPLCDSPAARRTAILETLQSAHAEGPADARGDVGGAVGGRMGRVHGGTAREGLGKSDRGGRALQSRVFDLPAHRV
jgi:tetratricopeptide (TPR) repeat protein